MVARPFYPAPNPTRYPKSILDTILASQFMPSSLSSLLIFRPCLSAEKARFHVSRVA